MKKNDAVYTDASKYFGRNESVNSGELRPEIFCDALPSVQELQITILPNPPICLCLLMETTFHLNANELDNKFLEALKSLFTGQNLVISVAAEMDTTEYLLSDPERKARLLESIQQVRNGNLIDVNLDDYRA